MYAPFALDFDIDPTFEENRSTGKTYRHKVPNNEPVEFFSKRQKLIQKMTKTLKADNTKHRRPCPICHNLVRPELQNNHNEAYHSKP